MNTTTYTRMGEDFIVTELAIDEFTNLCEEILNWDGSMAADVLLIEYADGSAYYYDGQESAGDLRNDGIVCGIIVDDVDVYACGTYYVDADGHVEVYDARLSLEAYAEACADSKTELDLVLADIADNFAGKQTYVDAFISAVQDEMADGYGHMVLRDAAESVIGDVIARAKEKHFDRLNQRIALLNGLAEVIVNNSSIECDEDDAPVFPDVVSVSVDGKSISVTMNDGSVYDVTVS